MKEFSAIMHGTQRIIHTFRWPCEPIILSVGHFEGPTEVQEKQLVEGFQPLIIKRC